MSWEGWTEREWGLEALTRDDRDENGLAALKGAASGLEGKGPLNSEESPVGEDSKSKRLFEAKKSDAKGDCRLPVCHST